MAAQKRRRKKKGGSGCLMKVMALLALLAALQILTVLGVVVYRHFFPNPPPVASEVVDPQAFFENYAPLAQRVGKKYGLFPSMILTQAAHESYFGSSELSQVYHNYFGIKGTPENGALLPTVEVSQGEAATVDQYFRTYKNARESFEDYAKLISQAPRYAEVVAATTPEDYARALQAGGYATDPNYAEKLISLFTKYQLDQYDPPPES
ncbi:MAG: glycoside hydrolase family 73 protein [Tissierellia bacterium]|nr:glycoside hydrolase family 73 protein [Tissierellia bacterium]